MEPKFLEVPTWPELVDHRELAEILNKHYYPLSGIYRLGSIAVDDVRVSSEDLSWDDGDREIVEEYRVKLHLLPPVVISSRNSPGWPISDGYHRIEAARCEGWETYPAYRHKGVAREIGLD